MPAGPSRSAKAAIRGQARELDLVLGAFRREPALRLRGTESERSDDRDRSDDHRPEHRHQRPVGELVERDVERDRGEIAGDEPQQVEVEVAGRFASLALGEFVPDRG